MPTNHTPNYNLNQWEASDRVLRTDFNSDNAKIDEVLEEHGEKLAGCGNCGIYFQTYSGTGTVGLKLTFPKKPVVVIVFDNEGVIVIALRDMPRAYMPNVNFTSAQWEGNTVTLSYSNQAFMNSPGRHYIAVALVDMGE